MKALNRKSSTTSLQMGEIPQSESSRGSMPPEATQKQLIITSSSNSSKGQRAKSVSKEPAPRDESQNGSLSRFFSLSRRIAKIRFTSSSQPPTPLKPSLNSGDEANNEDENQQQLEKTQSTQLLSVPSLDLSDSSHNQKKTLRERALSPSRLLGRLRPRSPFGRSNRNQKLESSENNLQTSVNTTIKSSSKSFTISPSRSPLLNESGDSSNNSPRDINIRMSASYHSGTNSNNLDESSTSSLVNNSSRFTRATTAVPEHMQTPSLTNDKTRSMSCEFIDGTASQQQNNSKSNKFRHVLTLFGASRLIKGLGLPLDIVYWSHYLANTYY